MHFCAAHKLWRSDWTAEKNHEVFGNCANENYHGHNYELIVTVKGEIQTDTGFLIDAKILKKIIQKHIVEQLDHKNLNVDVPFMKDKLTSVENLAVGVWNELRQHLPSHVQLHCVKIYETPTIYVEYFGN